MTEPLKRSLISITGGVITSQILYHAFFKGTHKIWLLPIMSGLASATYISIWYKVKPIEIATSNAQGNTK